jgi:hypothetical protein
VSSAIDDGATFAGGESFSFDAPEVGGLAPASNTGSDAGSDDAFPGSSFADGVESSSGELVVAGELLSPSLPSSPSSLFCGSESVVCVPSSLLYSLSIIEGGGVKVERIR